MSNPRKLYWDSSCFISFINSGTLAEAAKSAICADVLKNAANGDVEIWTSMWTIVEVIRPKSSPQAQPLPIWTKEVQSKVPESIKEIQKLWDYWTTHTAPARMLSQGEISKISGMFQWPYITKILIDEPTALAAVALSQKYGLRPADSIHAASAITTRCDVIQCFDRDYSKISSLIPVEEPTQISSQGSLALSSPSLAPAPAVTPPVSTEPPAK